MTEQGRLARADRSRARLLSRENVRYTMHVSICGRSAETSELCRRCVAEHPRLRPPGFLALYLLAARPSESRAGAYLGNRIPRGARASDRECALGGEMAGAISGIECSDALEPVQGRINNLPRHPGHRPNGMESDRRLSRPERASRPAPPRGLWTESSILAQDERWRRA